MSLRNSYYWTSDYPNVRIDVSYSQTARTGTSATYSVSMAVYFTSSGWHGYGFSAKCTINGASQTLRIKEPSNSWSGSGYKGTWTFNITASAGASGGTLPASIQLWGTDGDTTNINSGSKTVSLSTWNTAPTWTSDDANINGWKENKTIPENTGAVTVNLPSASDKEGNTIKYDVYRYVNGASNSKIASGTTSRTVSDNIGSFGQGTQIKYLVKCHDGSLWASGDRWSWVYTKNTFTPASVSASGSIGYSTSSITLTVSGAKNTNGNTTFSYKLFSPDGLTVFNETFSPNSSGQVTFSIYSGSGTRPSNPHIDFSELKSFVAKGTYKGTLKLKVQTNNAYGSSGSKEVSIAVDLRTNPVPAGLGTVTGAVTVAGGSYFVYNLSTVKVSWSGASDRLSAGSLSYELQYKYGTGAWNRLTTTTGTSWSGKLPAVTTATTCYFRVIATTTYGYSATSAEKSITMHYYNSPKVSYRSPNRTTSEFTVYIDSATNTSITAVAISSRTFTGLAGTSKAFTGSATLITDTGLTGNSSYNITVKVTDNSGLSNATTTLSVPVTTYIPIMSITNKGIAISTTADPAYKLNIGGSISVTGNIRIIDPSELHKSSGIFTYSGDKNGMGMAIQSGGAMVIGSGESPKSFIATLTNNGSEVTYITSDNNIDFITNCNTIDSRKHTARMTTTGNLHVAGEIYAQSDYGSNTSRVYHQKFKPTATDVGAYSKVNNTSYWGIGVNGNEDLYIRAPKSGIIPNVSNGASGNGGSSLGTTGWRFANVWATQMNAERYKIPSSTNATFGYEASSTDVYIANDANNWLRLKTDKTMTYAGYKVYTSYQKPTASEIGAFPDIAPDYSNANSLPHKTMAAYMVSNSANSPTSSYYTIWQIARSANSGDRIQFAFTHGGWALFQRTMNNGTWGAWKTLIYV